MRHDEFDREFRRTRRWVYGGMLVSGVVGLTILLFVAWVVVAVLNHLGLTDVSLPGLA